MILPRGAARTFVEKSSIRNFPEGRQGSSWRSPTYDIASRGDKDLRGEVPKMQSPRGTTRFFLWKSNKYNCPQWATRIFPWKSSICICLVRWQGSSNENPTYNCLMGRQGSSRVSPPSSITYGFYRGFLYILHKVTKMECPI